MSRDERGKVRVFGLLEYWESTRIDSFSVFIINVTKHCHRYSEAINSIMFMLQHIFASTKLLLYGCCYLTINITIIIRVSIAGQKLQSSRTIDYFAICIGRVVVVLCRRGNILKMCVYFVSVQKERKRENSSSLITCSK